MPTIYGGMQDVSLIKGKLPMVVPVEKIIITTKPFQVSTNDKYKDPSQCMSCDLPPTRQCQFFIQHISNNIS